MPYAARGNIERRFRAAAVAAGVAAAAIGGYFLVAWLSGAMTWRGFETITIKTNTSLCLLVCGVSLVMVAPAGVRGARWRVAQLLALLTLVLGGLTFLEHVTGFDFGIDQLLATEPPGAVGILHPNRMGPPAAISYTLFAMALLLLLCRKPRIVAVQWLAILLCLIALIGIIGYLYGVTELYGVARYTVIAWQTAIANLLLGVGLLCARPQDGIMTPVTSPDPGGAIIRRLLPFALFLPILLGWLRLQGEWHGLYQRYFGTSILIVSLIASYTILVYQAGRWLSRASAAERAAADSLQRTQALLLEAERLSHTGAWEWDLTTDLWTFSDQWLQIHGVGKKSLSSEELLAIAHPDDRGVIREAFDKLRRGAGEYAMEHRIVRQDTGEIRTVRARGQFVKDPIGRVVRVYGSAQDISDRKAIEEEALVQRQLLESVVENMPVGVVLAQGEDLKIILANPAYRALASGKEMMGKTLPEVWPEVRPGLWETYRKVAETGVPSHAVDERFVVARLPGGPVEERYASWSCIRVGLPGTESAILNVVWETTERKRAEEALRRSEAKYRSLFETSPDAILTTIPSGRILSANPAAERMFAMTEEGMRRAGRAGLIDVHDQRLGPLLEERRRTGTARGVLTFVRRDGSTFEGETVSVILSSVNRAFVIIRDITDRVRREEALRESEAKFRAVFELAAVGMGRVGFTDARWIDVNPALCRMLGYSRDFMRATPWPHITHPEDVDLDLIPFRRMAAGELETYTVEKRFIHRDGHHLWARLTLSLVRDREGRPDYEIAVIEDITERKRAVEELRQAKEELEERVRERTGDLSRALDELRVETAERFQAVEELRRNEQMLLQQGRLAAMGEMLANISHQWRQPLNVLGLILQEMERRYERGTFTKEYLEGSIARGRQLIAHMSQTIDDFRSFLNPQRARLSFDLREVVEKAVSMVRESLKGVDVQIAAEDGVTVEGYRNEYAQVVMNILINARDAFRERNVPDPRVTVRIFRERRSVVTIADNAGGIPAGIVEKIFDPYFTTKAPDKGTGIGLFMAKTIVERNMGGRLTVRNTGDGAEFRIEV